MAATVLVIGGGISGLITAYRLLVERPNLQLEVLEATSSLGGNVGTELVDGFVFERAAHAIRDAEPGVMQLIRDLGLDARVVSDSASSGRRYVYRGGRLHAVGARALFSSLLPLSAKLALLMEPFRARGDPGADETVGAFGRRRLGRQATELLLDPLVTGAYAGDIEKVSLPAGFPRFSNLERRDGSLALGLWRERRRRTKTTGFHRSRFLSFPLGLREIVDALATALDNRVRTDATVENVTYANRTYRITLTGGEVKEAQSVVIAVPAPRAAVMLREQNPLLHRALDAFPYAPVAVACLGYEREDVGHALDGRGFLVPRGQGLRVLGAVWTSTFFPAHVPPGKVNLRVYVGGAHDPEVVALSADELQTLVEGELATVLDLKGEPIVRRVYRYIQGLPQYNVGHKERLHAVGQGLWDRPGLYISGNAFRGVGIHDCVREGARVARDVLAFLGGAG